MVDVPDEKLATLISEAAFDSSKWINICDRCANLVSAKGSILIPFEMEERLSGTRFSSELEGAVTGYLKDGWYQRDIRENAAGKMLRTGFITDADVIPYADIAHSPYYQEMLRPHGLQWFAAINIQASDTNWALTVQRSGNADPMGMDDVKNLLAYQDMLNTSATIARHLGHAKILGASDILEQHGRAVVALGWGGRVVHVSALAKGYIGHAFQIVQGHLRACFERDRLPLERLLQSLCWGKILNASIRPIPLSRGVDLPPLVIYGTTLPERERDIFQPAAALLVIVDPSRKQIISAELLIDYYGVTSAEAKLAVSLFEGSSLEKHAIKNMIAPVTARNHLQSLLRKTETHSKAELFATLQKISSM
jgi:DNA-binding CsgD family transcriptional regulator